MAALRADAVLHSFTHLGGESADPAFSQALLEEAADRLRTVGCEVWLTPFGWVCEWELSIFCGETRFLSSLSE